MELPRPPHRWSLSPRKAVALQRRLAGRVRRRGPRGGFRRIAGVDAAFPEDGALCLAAVVLWDARTDRVLEEHVASRRLAFPYVPGLLSFREAPAILAALRRLELAPDVILVDGHGLAHPRRFGIACHLGVIVDRPVVGCAKSRLAGEHREPGLRRGSRAALRDRGERVGTVLRTRDGVKPVYVSIGHRVDLPTAERVVLDAARRFRLPEPTRLADRLVARAKRERHPG